METPLTPEETPIRKLIKRLSEAKDAAENESKIAKLNGRSSEGSDLLYYGLNAARNFAKEILDYEKTFMHEYALSYHAQKIKQAGKGEPTDEQIREVINSNSDTGSIVDIEYCARDLRALFASFRAAPVTVTDAQIEEAFKKFEQENTQLDDTDGFSFYAGADFVSSLLSAPTEAGRGEGGGWIAVKEQGPPFDEWVLVWCKIYGRYIGRFERIENSNFGQWNDGKETGVLPPIYWQHLPEAPKPLPTPPKQDK